MNFLIIIIALFSTVKTASYGVWCIKEDKNIPGGVSVFVLTLLLLAFLIYFCISSI